MVIKRIVILAATLALAGCGNSYQQGWNAIGTHVVTTGDVVHTTLLVLAVLSLLWTAWIWLKAFAAGMSDSPNSDLAPSLATVVIGHLLPIALFVAWWLT